MKKMKILLARQEGSFILIPSAHTEFSGSCINTAQGIVVN